MDRLHLTEEFLNKYKDRVPPFGFNGLGELVYMRTYSRIKPNRQNEVWWETVQRVVEGTYNMQLSWIDQNGLGWNANKAQISAQEMYDRMWSMKFLPPGRGLWAMGSTITEERNNYTSLNNCAFVSTKDMASNPTKPFCFLMDASMLGVGVSFDTLGAGLVTLREPRKTIDEMLISDYREGWVDSVHRLLNGYFKGGSTTFFDYSLIRAAGEPIKGFGGIASGPESLRQLHESIRALLDEQINKQLSKRTIVDIMNLIGKCVVAGNVRRSASMAIDFGLDINFLELKNYNINPDRAVFGWASNNSINVPVGTSYILPAEFTRGNGEPGYQWIENARAFSRMDHEPDNKDFRVDGVNPCGEQSLESFEICNLVETFPNKHDNLNDYKRTLKFAYLYAKTVTLGKTAWPETNRILLRNRRIGCSMSGIAQFISNHGLHEFKRWCEQGYDTVHYYDDVYSEWLCIPRSIKITCVKPSGTVSLLAGATPGIHYPHSRTYIRRVRLGINSKLLGPLKAAGYFVEPCVGQEDSTVVVEIPIKLDENIRTLDQVTMWEQLALAAFVQRYWADNQVSVTVTFDPETEGPYLADALNYYQYQLKGVSFMPRQQTDVFPQMPYEEITDKEYQDQISKLSKLDFSVAFEVHEISERFCDGETCGLQDNK